MEYTGVFFWKHMQNVTHWWQPEIRRGKLIHQLREVKVVEIYHYL